MFYLIRKGRPLTISDGSIRIFANAIEMGRLQRGDQPMVWRGPIDAWEGIGSAPANSNG